MIKPESVNICNLAELFDQRIKEVFRSEANQERVGKLAYNNFKKFYGCSQSMMQAFMDVLGLRDDFWFTAVGGLQAGGGCGLTCGALNTGFILISAKVGRKKIEDGFQAIKPMMEPCQRLGRWFKLQYKSTVCSEISGFDWFDISDVVAGHLNPTPKQKERLENCAVLTGGTAYKVAEILSEI